MKNQIKENKKRTITIRFRVNTQEHQEIEKNRKRRNFKKMSPYLREILCENNFSNSEKLDEILKILKRGDYKICVKKKKR